MNPNEVLEFAVSLFTMIADIGYSIVKSQAWLISMDSTMSFDEIMFRLTEHWSWLGQQSGQ